MLLNQEDAQKAAWLSRGYRDPLPERNPDPARKMQSMFPPGKCRREMLGACPHSTAHRLGRTALSRQRGAQKGPQQLAAPHAP